MSAHIAATPGEAGVPTLEAGRYPSSASAWFLVGALSLASIVSYLDRQILTLLFVPIQRDLQLSDTEVSLLAGLAFVMFFATFGLFMGWIADRWNRKALIAIGIGFWSLATMACGAAQNFVQLFAARMAVGVGESTLGPSAMSMISDSFPRAKLARALSVYTAAAFVGMGLALVVGGAGIQAANSLPPVHLPGLGALRPWQLTFMLVGGVGALAIVPILLTQEPKRNIVRPTEGGLDKGELLRFLMHNRWTISCFFLGFSLIAMSGAGTISWLPTYFQRVHGWAPHEVGYIYGLIVSFVSLAAVLLGPRVAEWAERAGLKDIYITFPMLCLGLAVVPSVAAFFVPDGRIAMALVGLKQFIITLPMALMSAALQLITPAQLRGRVSALYLFVGTIIAVAVGPVFVALLTDNLFKDESQVGMSIITNTLILVPLGLIILFVGIKHFRKSLAEANSWAAAEPPRTEP